MTKLSMSPLRLALLFLLSYGLAGCAQAPQHPLYEQSNGKYNATGHATYESYLQTTEDWLVRSRVILNGDRVEEIAMNMPFALAPTTNGAIQKGILLVHGLGDSPWSFRDLAQEFSQKGYLVHTVLLPGHGTRPADMINTDDVEWERLIREQVSLLKAKVDEVSLGGFSTGANLVTSYALDDPEIHSLFLYSPAFKSDEPFDFLTPVAAVFTDWIFTPSPLKQTNAARYQTVPMNGFAQYYQTSATVQKKLAHRTFDRPVFIAVSQDDSVVDVQSILNLFESNFTHPGSRLLWFGTSLSSNDNRAQLLSSSLPHEQISNFSHMSVLFSPINSHYGQKNGYRICHNGPDESVIKRCKEGEPVWYSAWGYSKEGKIHARLTFNPYFEEMIATMANVMDAK